MRYEKSEPRAICNHTAGTELTARRQLTNWFRLSRSAKKEKLQQKVPRASLIDINPKPGEAPLSNFFLELFASLLALPGRSFRGICAFGVQEMEIIISYFPVFLFFKP